MMWVMAALWLILIGILFFLIKKHKLILNREKIKLNKKFQKEEEQAKKSNSGIWQGKFMRPELYRALNRQKQKNKKR